MGLGIHYVGLLTNCSEAKLQCAEDLLKHAQALATTRGFTVVKTAHHQFTNPSAATISLILSQSHIVLHTWPEHKKMAFDIFACAEKEAVHGLIKDLEQTLQGKIGVLKMIDYE